MTNDESTTVSLRNVLVVLLSSEARESILSSLTPDERRAVIYQYSTVPTVARIEPNIPALPFSDTDMNRLLGSALDKIVSGFGQPEG